MRIEEFRLSQLGPGNQEKLDTPPAPEEPICLLAEKVLAPKYKDHTLSGNYRNYRECHIKPDLLLIYKIERAELVLYAVHIGSHSDLFKK